MANRRWMNENYVECKTYGHHWHYESSERREDRRHPDWGHFIRMNLRCETCTSGAYDDVEPPGSENPGKRLRARRIIYVEGYRADYGEDAKPTRNDLRIVLIRRRGR